jgi:hypothetical protein
MGVHHHGRPYKDLPWGMMYVNDIISNKVRAMKDSGDNFLTRDYVRTEDR